MRPICALIVSIAFVTFGFYFAVIQPVHEQQLRDMQVKALLYVPERSSSPVRPDEAKLALEALNLHDKAVAVAYQMPGDDKFGCVVVDKINEGLTPGNLFQASVAAACQLAGEKFLTEQAATKRMLAEPSFYDQNQAAAATAFKALPSGASLGNASLVLPLLTQAKIDSSEGAAILSWTRLGSEGSITGCLLVGRKIGVLRASGDNETDACLKVISMAKDLRSS